MKQKTLNDSLKVQMKNKTFKEAYEHYFNSYSIGFKIQQLRKEMKWTQVDLAKALGVSQQVVSRLERGEADNPTLETLERIAQVTGRRLQVEFAT